jgi:mannose-1-phosphate guanylyltransferase
VSAATARPTRAVVLVGGQGTRLRPLTYDIPKPMLPVGGRPIIEHILQWLGRHGVTSAVLGLGYYPQPFIDAFPSGTVAGVELAYAVEPEPLDTAGGIRFAAAHSGWLDEPLVVVNGDCLTDLRLSDLVEFHCRHGHDATIALTPVEDPSAYGVVAVDEWGRVLEFVEKPAPGSEPTNLINAGFYVLEPAVLAAIDPDRPVSIEREVFPLLVAKQELYAMASDAYWLDTGTPDRYRRAQLDVLRGRRPEVELPPGREIAPGVHAWAGAELLGTAAGHVLLGEGSLVELAAVVKDSVLGAAARVGEGATVRESVLLQGAVVEPAARVEASIIGPEATIGRGAVVAGDTIVGAGALVPAGARLDGGRVGR